MALCRHPSVDSVSDEQSLHSQEVRTDFYRPGFLGERMSTGWEGRNVESFMVYNCIDCHFNQ